MAYDRNYIELRDRGLRFLRNFCAARGQESLAWIAAPLFAVYYADPDTNSWPAESPRWYEVAVERAAARGLRQTRPAGMTARYTEVAGTIFLDVSRNHRLVLGPIIEEAERAEGVSRVLPEVRPSPRRSRELGAEAQQLTRALMSEAAAEDLPLPLPRRRILRDLISSGAHLAYAETILEQTSPGAVVAASNHGKPTRALARAARSRGLPSVYVPHAPMLVDPLLWDLPFDYAALRGESERELYEQRISVDRISIIGDPSLSRVTMVEIERDAPLVVAPPPYDELIERMAAELKRTGVENVVIAPHPAQEGTAISDNFPAEWEVSPLRAFELLRSGARGLVQHSSGLALESLLLGIPTIEMTFGRERSYYPFIGEPYVEVAGEGAGELGSALSAAEERLTAPGGRRALQEWARSWCAADGSEAAAAGWGVVRSAATGDPPGPLYDIWSGEPDTATER